MKKLLKLKQWLTLEDTAKHLSLICGEDVSRADVLRLCLDGHLTISVNFVNHSVGRFGKVIPISEAQYLDALPVLKGLAAVDGTHKILKGIRYGNDKVLELDSEVSYLEGIWDLPMFGCERLELEHEYQQLTGGPEITLQSFDGAFVCSPTDPSIMVQLQEHFEDNEFDHREFSREVYHKAENYYPAGGPPKDSVLVVRIESIRELEESLSQTDDKPPSTKTTNTYLKVISALSEALIDGLSGKKNTDAEAVLSALDLKGVKPPASKKTLANYLEEAKEL